MNELGASEAFELMQRNPECVYLDVRSVPEFEGGHATNAINIPIMHFTPGQGMTPNPDFAAVVEANLSKDTRLIVGCKSGMRSARACQLMSEMGYTNVTNLRGGFVGAMDNFGRVVEPGWSMLNLPTCSECTEQAGYETMLAKVKASS